MDAELPSSETVEQKAEALVSLIDGPLASSASRLLSRSRGLPSDKDFHFYNNFDEFKLPMREIEGKAESSLGDVASSTSIWGRKKPPPLPDELDEAYEWLVNLNDDFLEKFGISMDEFRSLREKQEMDDEELDSGEGFQVVYGKKKKRDVVLNQERFEGSSPPLGIKVVSRDMKTTAARAKVPFHLPNIPRPQTEFNILVNNKNVPFEHVWLERTEDKSHFIHPLEKLSVIDFIDRNIKEDEIVKPLSLEQTPFKLVESVKELKDMVNKLSKVNEFAVDLEHNNYRSYLGLTCLMQISTRMEDFVIDTLKLRVHIGPYLRELFKDPSKRKVLHGADRDILWLQRDFGLYICNLFDTGQASRLLQLERNSLEHLLHLYCDVEANKEYQNADWRIRPLPDEMMKYAREDTHYLLYIYDIMRCKLLSSSNDENDLLLEVYKRSSEVCMQFYEKEIWTDSSYLHIYGLSEAGFDSKQLAVVCGLCQWRDKIAREEDESTGYILPNKAVLEIARQMPESPGNLRQLVKSKHPYVIRQLSVVLKIIKHAIENSAAFDSAAEELRKKNSDALLMQVQRAENSESVTRTEHESPVTGTGVEKHPLDQIDSFDCHQEEAKMGQLSSNVVTVGGLEKEMESEAALPSQPRETTASTASVQAMDKPPRGFGALFGNASRRKNNPLNGNIYDQETTMNKLEEIKSSVTLPFYSFSSVEKDSETSPMENENAALPSQATPNPEQPSETAMAGDVIPLENSTDGSDSSTGSPCGEADGTKSDAGMTESHMSLCDLSSAFQQCSQLSSERRRFVGNGNGNGLPQEPQFLPELTPFDYAAARREMKIKGVGEEIRGEDDVADGTADGRIPAYMNARKGFPLGRGAGEQRERGQQQPRRRQAFPPSGNRSATYRC